MKSEIPFLKEVFFPQLTAGEWTFHKQAWLYQQHKITTAIYALFIHI
jgi:hypothetical protein